MPNDVFRCNREVHISAQSDHHPATFSNALKPHQSGTRGSASRRCDAGTPLDNTPGIWKALRLGAKLVNTMPVRRYKKRRAVERSARCWETQCNHLTQSSQSCPQPSEEKRFEGAYGK